MKVTITTIMYKREKVFDIYACNVKKLISHFKDIEFNVVVVGSTPICKRAATKHGFTYYYYANLPIGAKAQYRLERARETNADYYLFLGSDDIISIPAFAYCLKYMKQGYEHIAPYDIFYNYKQSLYYSQGYDVTHSRYLEPLAVGRILSKGLLERLNWKLWDDTIVRRGLDKPASDRIKRANPKSHYYWCMDIDGGYIIDFKTETNLSQIRPHKWQYIGATKDYYNYE